jgi:integrase
LDKLLAKRQKLARGHHAAMPFADVPEFMARLRQRNAMAALALEITILTAARTSEVLGARTSEHVLPGQRPGTPLSGMAMEMILRRMKIDGATVHGFRSSFRDWCGEETTFPREVAEAALAHVAGDQTELAYRRGDALEKRRALMEAWATYLRTEGGQRRFDCAPSR